MERSNCKILNCVLRIGAVQAAERAFTFLFNGSLYGKKIKMSVTSHTLNAATAKMVLSLDRARRYSFPLKYRYCMDFCKDHS